MGVMWWGRRRVNRNWHFLMTTAFYPSLGVELPDVEAEDNDINFVQQKVTPDIEVVVEDDEDKRHI